MRQPRVSPASTARACTSTPSSNGCAPNVLPDRGPPGPLIAGSAPLRGASLSQQDMSATEWRAPSKDEDHERGELNRPSVDSALEARGPVRSRQRLDHVQHSQITPAAPHDGAVLPHEAVLAVE